MKKFITLLIILTSLFGAQTASPKIVSVNLNDLKEVKNVEKMIKAIKPALNDYKRMKLAFHLNNISKKYKIDPKIMIAIIDTESDFDNTKISTTGDLSLAQINTDIWNRELKRMKLPEIDSKRLKTDEHYALNQMAMILSILKNRHSSKDGIWFARYHSHTKKYKNVYFAKVDLRMRKIASVN
jgi:hypothetical protein